MRTLRGVVLPAVLHQVIAAEREGGREGGEGGREGEGGRGREGGRRRREGGRD